MYQIVVCEGLHVTRILLASDRQRHIYAGEIDMPDGLYPCVRILTRSPMIGDKSNVETLIFSKNAEVKIIDPAPASYEPPPEPMIMDNRPDMSIYPQLPMPTQLFEG